MDILFDSVVQKIYHVTMVSNRASFALLLSLECHTKSLFAAFGAVLYPALSVTCIDTARIHLCGNAHSSGNIGSLRLCTTHTTKTAGNEEFACQVAPCGDVKLHTSCVKQRVEGTMYNPLRANVHPTSCGHLTIVGNPHLSGNLPIFEVVVEPYHHRVCDDNTGCAGVRSKQT